MSVGSSIPDDSGLACLVMLSRYFGVAANAGQMSHQLGREGEVFSPLEILHASKLFGLKARQITSFWSRIGRIQFPAIASHSDGHFFVIGGVRKEEGELKVLIQDPLAQGLQFLSQEPIEQDWSGELILLTKRAGLQGADRKFDFKWFFPQSLNIESCLVRSCSPHSLSSSWPW